MAQARRRNSARDTVSYAVTKAVLAGKGCPWKPCGFMHGVRGPYRNHQLEEILAWMSEDIIG